MPRGRPALKEAVCLFVCLAPAVRGQLRLLVLLPFEQNPLSLELLLPGLDSIPWGEQNNIFPLFSITSHWIKCLRTHVLSGMNFLPSSFIWTFLILQGPTKAVAFLLCSRISLLVLLSQLKSNFLVFLVGTDIPAFLTS